MKALVFCTEADLDDIKTRYDKGFQQKNFEVVSYAVFENKKVNLIPNTITHPADIAILHSHRLRFHSRLKFIESLGFPAEKIIDGRVFKVPSLDFPRLLKEGIAYGVLNKKSFLVKSWVTYPQVYSFSDDSTSLSLGKKSYIGGGSRIEGKGIISIGNVSALSWNLIFSVGQNSTHNYRNVSSISRLNSDWAFPENFLPPKGTCEIRIGSDVWVGRGCILKATNPNKPLVIGDGAVIASDSVVVKNVPPYAIVGGNPAKVIKYRFEPHVIESLLRIKWWDWSLDKIHDNFKYFNDVEKFCSLHDK